MSTGSLTPPPRLTGGPGYGRRRAVNRAMEGLSTLAAVVAIAVLALVVVSVVIKAAPAINLNFLTQDPNPTASLFGKVSGGIANSIVGSAILIAIASLISVPIAILVAIYTTEFAGQRVATTIRFALDLLNGVPTIVIGIFIFGIIVIPAHTQSGWAGAVALAIVELPIVARSAQEVLALVPGSLREGIRARHWVAVCGVEV
jgi:phosphate transport system permease protein